MPDFSAVDSPNSDQRHAWDGTSGAFWAERAEHFDRGMAGYHEELLKAAAISPDSTILDIGCGCGQLTRDAARIAHRGSVLGVDLSSAMLEHGRTLAASGNVNNVSFVQADAQVYNFDPSGFDIAVSRHGTMFFADPTAAFTNIASALRPGGRLVQLTWQPLDRNEGIQTFRTIASGGRHLPPPPPEAPSPFALSDPDRVTHTLHAAGFGDIEMTSLTMPMYYGRNTDDAFNFIAAHFAAAFDELADTARARAHDTLRANIAQHLTDQGVFYGAAHWLIAARKNG